METPEQDIDLGGEGGQDPFDEVPADPEASLGEGVQDVSQADEGERLGGEGATLDDDAPPPQVSDLGEGEEEPEPEPEPTPDPEPEPTPEPEPEPEAQAEAEEEPTPKEKSKAKAKRSETRPYTVLVETKDGKWEEPDALKGKKRPVAANGEQALRAAYKVLVPEGDTKIVMAVISDHYWNPQPVAAKVREDRAISIG